LQQLEALLQIAGKAHIQFDRFEIHGFPVDPFLVYSAAGPHRRHRTLDNLNWVAQADSEETEPGTKRQMHFLPGYHPKPHREECQPVNCSEKWQQTRYVGEELIRFGHVDSHCPNAGWTCSGHKEWSRCHFQSKPFSREMKILFRVQCIKAGFQICIFSESLAPFLPKSEHERANVVN
jgi:hypothetical protein